MIIRLQTSKGRDIPNGQNREISAINRNWGPKILAKYFVKSIRTDPSPIYNCHGLTFASRRTRIPDSSDVATILQDDHYKRIERHQDVLPGDIVIYVDENGDLTHSGVVVENDSPLFVPMICSKWGDGPEVIHAVANVHPLYGSEHRFYRCRL